MRDDVGIVQLWTISPLDGEPKQITNHRFDVVSAFSWSPDASSIAYIADTSVFITKVACGTSERLTEKAPPRIRRGQKRAYSRPTAAASLMSGRWSKTAQTWNQIFVVTLPGGEPGEQSQNRHESPPVSHESNP